MKKNIAIFLLFLTIAHNNYGQGLNIKDPIDSLLTGNTKNPFNGIILISQNGVVNSTKIIGYSDINKKKELKGNDQFIIGSISKQITAVIVLRELEAGHLQLSDPISKYLPDIKRSWADSVTINHLLLHQHGIQYLNKPLAYPPGTKFDYSLANTGYQLLSQIVEKTSGKSFAKLSSELFKKCGMNNTFHPAIKKYKNLVKGYTEQTNGTFIFETSSFQNSPAAGGLISTASDLVNWNENLHKGQLLKPETYAMMVTKQPNAIRNHPLFGLTNYGYGITVSTSDSLLQLGQTGFAPGFASMDFYFPETGTSVIVLENTAYNTGNLKNTFFFHTAILNIIRRAIK